jgi:hypothetical protein
MRAFRSLAIALCATAITLSACSSKDPEPAPTAPTIALPTLPDATATSLDDDPATADAETTETTAKATATTRASSLAGRISDPQVAADRLVTAWLDGDKSAARKLTTTAVVDQLFAETPPEEQPPALPCSLYEPGVFACAYTLAERAEMVLVVRGGASAAYTITAVTFGD